MKITFLYLTIFALFINSCGPNVLSGLGSQTSDEYYLEEATKANNSQNYDYALDVLLNKLSAGAQARASTKELLASAYAGKCGFNFVEYVTALAESTGSPFNVVMQPFVQVAAAPEYCLLALQTIDTIGTPSQRTTNQNTFSAITGLVLMGISLRAYADKDGTDNNGDGLMDVDNMVCQAGQVSDDQMNDIIVGYGYFVTNFAYIGAMLGNATSGLDDSISMCTSIPTADCDVTDKNSVNSDTRDIMRRLLNTTNYGIGDEQGDDAMEIAAACPGT
ncbi:hypothetical protein [Pseudobdellovibrio sp. HCB154]|uniref:hypothetical protein n=1 Tax=Pseudobdellovibrio sp. HCB154 TaxID=3386277 RepID=UPI003917096D